MRGLQDKVVIVTGAASGIGRATMTRLVEEGAYVAAVDVNEQSLKDVVGGFGDRVSAIAADVSSEDAVESYFAEVSQKFERVDALHANAAILGPTVHVADYRLEDYQQLIAVNQIGVFLNLREMLRHARRQGTPASVVITASGTAVHGVPGSGAYGSTKAAIIGLTRAAARESAASGCRVNAVVPGPIDTPMTGETTEAFFELIKQLVPMQRLGTSEEVAALVAFLLSDESTFITGGIYPVDGGELA